MSRNASNGRNELEGDFLMNAQGEDVVAGIRITEPISELKAKLPEVYDQFREIARKLEQHYRNMQDMSSPSNVEPCGYSRSVTGNEPPRRKSGSQWRWSRRD